jgi:polysaccharide pyruvyl transferase WcaK-like protein
VSAEHPASRTAVQHYHRSATVASLREIASLQLTQQLLVPPAANAPDIRAS